ncbi:hypothetical protein A3J32_03040 [Candidatus Saccharibacteria bacterium RIFCSPLOWO2_02_FULL_46_7]|nr:MAG: hypothetical protein A3J32_03040 [Candidatus Saccharibacteria bacterium RIFCSPLOWO2_02_FULL_46_7]
MHNVDMKKNQSGFSVVEGLLILVIVALLGGAGWYAYNASNKADESSSTITSPTNTKDAENNKTCTPTAEWKEYSNTEYKHSFYYPPTYKAEEAGGLGGSYGDVVLAPNNMNDSIFTVNVLLWPDGTTVGNVYGSVDAMKKALKEGGAKRVAELSSGVNKDDNPYIQNDTVGDLKEFKVCRGEAWGFNVTGDFSTGFVKAEEGGTTIDEETTIVFVTNGTSVYQIEYPASSAEAKKVLPTFKMP